MPPLFALAAKACPKGLCGNAVSGNLRGEPDGGHKEYNDRNAKQHEKPKRRSVRRCSRLLIAEFTSTPNGQRDKESNR
jgi:hypothetical protein